MYHTGFTYILGGGMAAVSVATFFVILSQIKINVTNAYSGSLSWSNFFSRLLHAHPGRVVYIFFNVGISLTLMELNMFSVLGHILGFYSNVAVAWIGAVTADLVINKPLLKLSPSYVEFKRAHLYNFNPVGFGSMMIASVISVLAFFGLFGAYAAAYSAFIALGVSFVLSPIIAIVTKGKYYIARDAELPCRRPAQRDELRVLRLRIRDAGHGGLPLPQRQHLLALLLARFRLP